MIDKKIIVIVALGLFTMMAISTTVKYSESKLYGEEEYIKHNLISAAKKCINDVKCNKINITVNELNNKGYIEEALEEALIEYDYNSYIIYPSFEVVLIK